MGGHVLGDRPRLRHHRHAQGPSPDRDHHLPGRGLRPGSRKPVVAFGTSLEDDLLRRDFTINAMALRLPVAGARRPVRRRPRPARAACCAPRARRTTSFSDDPLRMMRAARFAAQLGVTVAPEVVARRWPDMAGRIEIISAERVRDELVKLVCAARPADRRGPAGRHRTGRPVLPEVAALRLEIDEHHRHKDVYQHSLTCWSRPAALESDDDGPVPGPDFVLRFAALMHDVGKPATRRFEPGGAVSFRHHDMVGVQADRQADEGAALRQRHHQGRGPAGGAAHALLRLRRGRLDAIRRSAATSPTPARCWSACTG